MAYHHLNTLTIFPERLAHNLDVLSCINTDVCVVPVVKSNAYGHGIEIIAPLLQNYDTPFVCVNSLYEAYELRKFGYKKDVLIMGYVDPRDILRNRHFIYAVSTMEYAMMLIQNYSQVRLYLFLDTGMHREGLRIRKNEKGKMKNEGLLKLVPHIEGIMSHLSTPENSEVSDLQLKNFYEHVELLLTLGFQPKYVHILASGGLINRARYNTEIPLLGITSIARCGLAYYGYGHPDLLPAIRCTTTLIQIKDIRKGDTVGYDGTFIAKQDMKIGILPIGYHDGLDRRLSNTGIVGIGDQLCPIVGRISMNLATIDISDMRDVREGDEVVLVDERGGSPLSLASQSERASMIPYDFLVHLNREMYRTIIRG